MSKSSVKSSQIFHSVVLVGLFVTTSTLYAGNAGRTCASAVFADLNSSLRGFSDQQGEPFFVKLEIPSAGILSVDVAVPGAAPVEPKLGLPVPDCGMPQANSELVVLERSATHLVLVAQRSGPYVFHVASQDPMLPLGELKIRTGFVPSGPFQGFFDKGGEDEEEIEIDAEPKLHGGGGEYLSLHSRLHELCRRGEVDDHGDSFPCATFLSPGRNMAGEIRNGWGDDGDVFLVVLSGSRDTRLWTLEIETTGGVDTFGALYDHAGIRLEKADEGGGGANFRIARTLPPGIYFVRVEGRHGAEGPYALAVDASPWR